MKVQAYGESPDKYVGFDCPGCGRFHTIPTAGPRAWSFNGDFELPTFNPSLLVRGTQWLTDEEYDRIRAGEKIEPRPLVCHSFIRDGHIQFLSDCTHEMAGKTVALPEVKA
jgi:hypothetical protein